MNYILLSFIVVLGISLWAGLKASKQGKDFFLASRAVRWPMLVGTFVGTQVGGGFILGNCDASYSCGVWGSMYGIGIALGMLFLGIGYGARLRRLNITTIPELLEKKYDCETLRKVASSLSLLSLVGILMCQAIGLLKFLQAVGGASTVVFLLAWGAVIIYTTCGGLLAVVWTDAIQVVAMVLMLCITFLTTLLPNWDIIVEQATVVREWNGATLAPLLVTCCFIFIEQDMAQRCFAAKTPKDATIACLVTALVLIVLTVIPTCSGLLGRAAGLSMKNGSIFMQVMKACGSPVVFASAAFCVLLAIISTASSVLLAASSNLIQDFIGQGRWKKIGTCFIGMLALFGPYISNDIVSCMVLSYEISVGALFVPIVMAVLFDRKFPQEAAWGSIVLGSLGTLVTKSCEMGILSPVIPIGVSFVGYFCGFAWAKRRRVYREELV